eukprot:2891865-Rhodomonas_salina.4
MWGCATNLGVVASDGVTSLPFSGSLSHIHLFTLFQTQAAADVDRLFGSSPTISLGGGGGGGGVTSSGPVGIVTEAQYDAMHGGGQSNQAASKLITGSGVGTRLLYRPTVASPLPFHACTAQSGSEAETER